MTILRKPNSRSSALFYTCKFVYFAFMFPPRVNFGDLVLVRHALKCCRSRIAPELLWSFEGPHYAINFVRYKELSYGIVADNQRWLEKGNKNGYKKWVMVLITGIFESASRNVPVPPHSPILHSKFGRKCRLLGFNYISLFYVFLSEI